MVKATEHTKAIEVQTWVHKQKEKLDLKTDTEANIEKEINKNKKEQIFKSCKKYNPIQCSKQIQI